MLESGPGGHGPGLLGHRHQAEPRRWPQDPGGIARWLFRSNVLVALTISPAWRRRRCRRYGLSVTITAVLLLTPVRAGAQAIGGTVTDPTGSVLPRVTVEVRSPSLIEQVRRANTDGRGQYLIVALAPGVYSVTYRLPGFGAVVREGVRVGMDTAPFQ